MPSGSSTPYWKRKSLRDMSDSEWENLCDGCGRCCLSKLEDEDTGKIYYTDIGCVLLDGQSCGCRDYPNRQQKVGDCVRLTPETVSTISWLPPSCAYRLIAEGRDLYWWHHLVSGDRETVHIAGVSVRGRVAMSETALTDDADLQDHIVRWPKLLPKRAKLKRP